MPSRHYCRFSSAHSRSSPGTRPPAVSVIRAGAVGCQITLVGWEEGNVSRLKCRFDFLGHHSIEQLRGKNRSFADRIQDALPLSIGQRLDLDFDIIGLGA